MLLVIRDYLSKEYMDNRKEVWKNFDRYLEVSLLLYFEFFLQIYKRVLTVIHFRSY